MGRLMMRWALIAGVVVGFIALLLAFAFELPALQWIVLVGYTLLGVGIVLGLVRRRGRPRKNASELSASDEYSDLQLGRRPVTHYPRDETSSSQIGDPPSRGH